jgi:hypothetical protein
MKRDLVQVENRFLLKDFYKYFLYFNLNKLFLHLKYSSYFKLFSCDNQMFFFFSNFINLFNLSIKIFKNIVAYLVLIIKAN